MTMVLSIALICLAGGETLRPQVLPEAEARPVAADEVLVSMEPGHGPGRYHFRTAKGDPYRPRYFNIGANGCVYVLDSDQGGVHTFESDGTLRGFVFLTFPDPRAGIYVRGPLAVTLDGTIYVLFAGQGHTGIGQFGPEGHLKAVLGEEGPIPPEHWQQALSMTQHSLSPYAGPRAFGGVGTLYASPDGSLLILGHRAGAAEHEAFSFDPQTGRTQVSAASADTYQRLRKEFHDSVKGLAQHAETAGGKAKRDWEDACKRDVILAPDGCLYYMTVFPEVLEVHRVRFEDAPKPSQ